VAKIRYAICQFEHSNQEATSMATSYYIWDTIADRNSIPAIEGTLAYVKANGRLYFRDASEWRQIRY